MIRVTRPPAPPIFASERIKALNEDLWNHYQKSTQQRMKFRTDLLRPVREDLRDLFHNKCAYCETKIGIAADFDIENHRPKSGVTDKDRYLPQHYFWLAYEWENLLPSCQVCNRTKNNLFPIADENKRAEVGDQGSTLTKEEPLLLDPCLDFPEEHLDFQQNGTVNELTIRGKTTIEILNLNRKPLVNARQNAISAFTISLKQGILSEKEIKELLSEQTAHEYAGALRAAYRRYYSSMPILSDTLSIEKQKISKITQDYKSSTKDLDFIQRQKRFSIRTIEIKNFRTISHLNLEFKNPDSESERESWMLFLGDNGVGKSSILQAIALALCGKNQLRALKPKVEDYLKRGETAGFIRIESYEKDEPILLTFDKSGFKGMVKEPPVYLLGYGATRLLPRRGLGYSPPLNPYVNISNLFDYSYPLNDVNAWLMEVDRSVFQDRIAPALFDLLDLDDGESVEITSSGRLEIRQHGGSVDIDKTSDGYKSIIALACDIMKTLSNEVTGYHSAHGIVMIDELGNHLHPRWRMKIAEALRSAFPRLQFIVSTHEPLCLRGLQHGEVVVLVEHKKSGVFAIDKGLLPDHSLMKVDQLLTSDLFGLINTFDKETEKRFDDYYKLLSIPANERNEIQREQIASYTRLLSGKEIVGNTPQVQAVYQIVNEKFAKALVSNDFKTQQQLKEETVREVKDMLDLDKLDWL